MDFSDVLSLGLVLILMSSIYKQRKDQAWRVILEVVVDVTIIGILNGHQIKLID